MAYMNQENKKSKEPRIKALCKQYGIQGTLSVRHHSTLVLTLHSGTLDFIGNYIQVLQKQMEPQQPINEVSLI